ncbi:hypothetical protein P4O66_000468 [Electrophorus voltai]|uniref:Uncharacterized protein n=1 Tax=Electrophorus voltai TaxID=2609070 RepID=A0AAD8ZHP3_9TELE|nr:hypothetical protein P4O66_000468 [Electrophorus voltai]
MFLCLQLVPASCWNLLRYRNIEGCLGRKERKGRGRRDANAVPQPSQETLHSLGHPAHPHHRGECCRRILGGPEFGPGSDSAESYGPGSDYRDWYNGVQYLESDSAGFYDPTMDYHEGYMDSERKGEYNDISLRSDFESDREEDPSMEVEKVLHRDPTSYSDIADSESDKPPAPKAPPKAPPRACRSGVSKRPRVTGKEASSSEEDTSPPKANSPRAHALRPKPRRGKKAVAPVHVPETGKTAGVLPNTHVPKPEQPPLLKPPRLVGL